MALPARCFWPVCAYRAPSLTSSSTFAKNARNLQRMADEGRRTRGVQLSGDEVRAEAVQRVMVVAGEMLVLRHRGQIVWRRRVAHPRVSRRVRFTL